MNERIRELVFNAAGGMLSYDEDGYKLSQKEVEKFAELIVRECVNVCLDRHDTWRWDEEADSDSGPRDCAKSIKQHFGVEE